MLWQASSITARSKRRGAEDVAIEARRCGAEDVGLVQDLLDGLAFESASVVQQALGLLPGGLLHTGLRFGPRVATCFAEQNSRFLDQFPGQSNVGVLLNEEVQRVFAQAGHDASRMAQADGLRSSGKEPLKNVVDSHVARCAGEDLLTVAHGLANQFHHGGGLAGAGWAVDEGQVTSGKGEANGLALGGVETRIQGNQFLERMELGRTFAEEDVAKFGKPLAASGAGEMESRLLAGSGDFVV